MIDITTIIPVLLKKDRICALNETLKSIPNDNNIVIIDSGDVDLIHLIDQSNVRQLIYRSFNIGQWETRKQGLELVTTEYVHFLDADDILSYDAYDFERGHDMYQLFPRVFDYKPVISIEERTYLTACSCQIFRTSMARDVMNALPIGRHNYNECFLFMLQALALGYSDFVHHDSTVQRKNISGAMFEKPPKMNPELDFRVNKILSPDISCINDYYVNEYFRIRLSHIRKID